MSLVLEERPAPYVVLLRLNRPEARNALSPELRGELRAKFLAMAEDPEVRAIVLTGDQKAFAAGADIRSMVSIGPGEMMRRNDDLNWSAIRHSPKPIIAAVNGYALGGGCELAMHADIIVAGEGATFGQPEVKLGIMPGAGGTQRLARAIGRYRAMLMLLTGSSMSAREAYEAGLVSLVTPDDDTVARAIAIATTIAAMPPLAVAEIKQVLHAGLDAPLDTALMLERRAAYLLFDSEDKREAMTAFLEKRKPVLSGR
ncbi:enoyl-CoA hydratase-related protein [Microvirga antarctica]|uniref:enoyl-CoA hydratase-related protein n=1 Tax=Microvirga antarctica TaxID=2819233 RepID=UPI001B307898|nr:enoyl-CoA hydratase-related protein [Microvirga antarctica]